MSNEIMNIAIVDDHTLFRSGLASLLSEFDEINVVFEATNGSDL
ncbi:MAG: response regulator transcription factor, partial [Pedobacter sp.]